MPPTSLKAKLESFSFIHSQWLPISAALVSPMTGCRWRSIGVFIIPLVEVLGRRENVIGSHQGEACAECVLVWWLLPGNLPLSPPSHDVHCPCFAWATAFTHLHLCRLCSRRDREQRCRQYIFLIYVLSCGNVGKSSSVHTPRWHTAPFTCHLNIFSDHRSLTKHTKTKRTNSYHEHFSAPYRISS